MEKEQLKRIFDFLEEKEGQIHKDKGTYIWKLAFNEPLTEEDLNIKGNLNLSNSKITSLPEGLKVGGNLYLRFSSITSLPEGLKVGNDLFLHHSKITSLPEGLILRGNLYLSYTNITLLPEELKVGGNLHIDHTLLKKYTNKELREMIKPGFIKGKIYRT